MDKFVTVTKPKAGDCNVTARPNVIPSTSDEATDAGIGTITENITSLLTNNNNNNNSNNNNNNNNNESFINHKHM